jgi:hypothetical protein
MKPLEIKYESDGRVTLSLDLKVTIEPKDTFALTRLGYGDAYDAELQSLELGAVYLLNNQEMTDRIKDILVDITKHDVDQGWTVTDVQEVAW